MTIDYHQDIDHESAVPYYIQLKEALQHLIKDGNLKPGDQLPSEPELCQLYQVSRTVVRQALQEMHHSGLIVRRKGKGTFIAEPKISENLVQKLTGFYQDMTEKGHHPVSKVLRHDVIPASQRVAKSLNIAPKTQVFCIERLRFVDNEPIVLVTTYLPYDLCPTLADVDLGNQSLYAYLEEACDLLIVRGRRVIEAVAANEREAKLLKVEEGVPLILLDSVSFLEDGTPIEYYHAVHRGDRSQFEVELVRIQEQGKVKTMLGDEDVDLPPSNAIVDE